LQLRPYQLDAIDAARTAFRQQHRSVLLVCPTGGGKTIIAAEIIRAARARGTGVLFLAHRRELVHQTSEKLTLFGVPHGIIMSGQPMSPQHGCQVASIQTLRTRREALGGIGLIFFDEAHHAAAKTYKQVLDWFPNARVVGLTATPWREDGRGLSDIFAQHTVVSTPRQLRDAGFLCPVGGWRFEALDTTQATLSGGNFTPDSLDGAANARNVVCNVVDEYATRAMGKRAIVFAWSIEMSRRVVADFNARGIRAVHIDGETPSDTRDAALASLRSGEVKIISNFAVLTEGFDCPSLEVCILARPTLNTGLYLQMIGRVLRPHPGKTEARIHDHAGLLMAHGHPYADRNYTPSVTALARVKRKSLNSQAKPALCVRCGSIRAGSTCDACGYVDETAIEVVDGIAIPIIEAPARTKKHRGLTAEQRADAYANATQRQRENYYNALLQRLPSLRMARDAYYRWSGDTDFEP
jgi:superfamily II DNA or RNA helicase